MPNVDHTSRVKEKFLADDSWIHEQIQAVAVAVVLTTFVGGGAGPAIDLTSILISGQRDVATNEPAEACPPASVPIDSLSLPLSWAVSGDAVTLTLDVFPTTPFLCGYASFVMTPPEMPTATTTVTELESGSPVELHFQGGSTGAFTLDG